MLGEFSSVRLPKVHWWRQGREYHQPSSLLLSKLQCTLCSRQGSGNATKVTAEWREGASGAGVIFAEKP